MFVISRSESLGLIQQYLLIEIYQIRLTVLIFKKTIPYCIFSNCFVLNFLLLAPEYLQELLVPCKQSTILIFFNINMILKYSYLRSKQLSICIVLYLQVLNCEMISNCFLFLFSIIYIVVFSSICKLIYLKYQLLKRWIFQSHHQSGKNIANLWCMSTYFIIQSMYISLRSLKFAFSCTVCIF